MSLADDVHDALVTVADPARAPAMAAYMRDQFPFLGVDSPTRAVALREVVAGLDGRPSEAELVEAARALWARDEREHQYAACWLLRRYVAQLSPSSMPVAYELLTTKAWWDTVDELAINVVGPIILRARDELGPLMDQWIDDDDLWIARTAILHQNRYKDATDEEQLFAHCLRRAGDTEFFIRKAIGWALRDYSKVDEHAVRRFVDEHAAELSGLSKREALKWLERRGVRG